MFVHKNMKRKLPLPNSSSREIPIFQLTDRADDAAGPDMHQTAEEFRVGRKGGSILINLSFESLPLINTCSALHLVFSLLLQGRLSVPSLRAFSGLNVKKSQSSNVHSTACSCCSFWKHSVLKGHSLSHNSCPTWSILQYYCAVVITNPVNL